MKSHGFPKIYTVGSTEVKDVFNGAVEITEKLDGSCIGFGIVDGELIVRSKNKELSLTKPESMFAGAVAYIKSIREKLQKDVFRFLKIICLIRTGRMLLIRQSLVFLMMKQFLIFFM